MVVEPSSVDNLNQFASKRVPENSANRFAHIDALRAFAVFLVVLEHSGLNLVPGDSGVTFFFTISGFIITLLLLREQEQRGRFDVIRFYRRRALKLAPPFVVAILLPTLVWMFIGPINLLAVLSQVLFSYNWVQIFANDLSYKVLPGSNVVWSLGVEEQFYIAFSLIWLILVGRAHARAWLVGLCVVAIAFAHGTRITLLITDVPHDHLLRGTDARMDALAWGVIAAVLYSAWSKGGVRWLGVFSRNAVVPFALVVYAVLAIVQIRWSEALLRPAIYPLLAASVILYGLMPNGSGFQALFYRVATCRPIAAIGLASYSIYLAHAPIMAISYDWLGDVVGVAGRAIILIPVGLGAGYLLYRLVEVPTMRLRTRRHW